MAKKCSYIWQSGCLQTNVNVYFCFYNFNAFEYNSRSGATTAKILNSKQLVKRLHFKVFQFIFFFQIIFFLILFSTLFVSTYKLLYLQFKLWTFEILKVLSGGLSVYWISAYVCWCIKYRCTCMCVLGISKSLWTLNLKQLIENEQSPYFVIRKSYIHIYNMRYIHKYFVDLTCLFVSLKWEELEEVL